MIAIILFVFVLTCLFYFIRLPFNYWKNKKVIYPPVSYVFGNFRQAIFLKKSVADLYDELYKKYPELNYIGFYKIRTPCILLRHPDIIKEVLVKNFDSFGDNEICAAEKDDPLFAKNPFVSQGQRWKENRSELAPAFTAKRVKEMYPVIESTAQNLVKYINNNIVGRDNGGEAKQLFVKYTTDVVTNCALGLNANSFVDSNSEYIKMIKLILAPSFFYKIKILIIFNFPILTKLFKIKFIPDEAANYYRTIINEATKHRIENKVHRGDFLDTMNKLKDPTKSSSFADDDIAGHVVSFLTEGTETSSTVLSFTLYELAIHTDIQAKLIREIDETIATNKGKLSMNAILNMEYLDQIIKESIRKNTVVPTFRKVCTKQFTLKSPDGYGASITIEPGTPVIIPVYSIHQDPKYYPDPSVFDPLRFSKDNQVKRPNFTYMPFGKGPRNCLGMRFGITQVKVALVHIIKNFEIKINKKTVVPYRTDPQHFIHGAMHGLWLDFYKRQL